MAKAKAVLIIGGSGFIGSHLAMRLRDTYKVYATYHRQKVQIPGVTMIPLSLENRDWTKRIIYLSQPDVILYAAGSNDVLWAEKNPHETELHHTSGAANLCTVADILSPMFIYLSNSYVFDGQRGNYHENDIVVPATALGKAKLGGENFIKSKSLNYVIVRSAPLLGLGNGYNLTIMDRLKRLLSQEKSIELPDDEFHNFGLIDGLVEMIVRIIETGAKKRTYHYGGLTKITHYEMARTLARSFSYNEKLLCPKSSHPKKNGLLEISPPDYSLNCTHSIETLKIKPLFIEEIFETFRKKLIPKAPNPFPGEAV